MTSKGATSRSPLIGAQAKLLRSWAQDWSPSSDNGCAFPAEMVMPHSSSVQALGLGNGGVVAANLLSRIISSLMLPWTLQLQVVGQTAPSRWQRRWRSCKTPRQRRLSRRPSCSRSKSPHQRALSIPMQALSIPISTPLIRSKTPATYSKTSLASPRHHPLTFCPKRPLTCSPKTLVSSSTVPLLVSTGHHLAVACLPCSLLQNSPELPNQCPVVQLVALPSSFQLWTSLVVLLGQECYPAASSKASALDKAHLWLLAVPLAGEAAAMACPWQNLLQMA